MATKDGAWIEDATVIGGKDSNKNTWPLNCTTEGTLMVDTTGSGPAEVIVDNVVTIAGTVAVSNFPTTQPVSGTVSVSNFPVTQPVSGQVTEANVDKSFGTWAYYAGTSGTVVVSAGQRVIGIGAHATMAGSFTINGGASIPLPANISINISPLGNLVAPTIVFTGTDGYFIEVVS